MSEYKESKVELISDRLSPQELGLEFIERWYSQDLINKNQARLTSEVLKSVGELLAKYDKSFNRRPYGPKYSPLNLGDIYWLYRNLQTKESILPMSPDELLENIHSLLSLDSLYFPVGSQVTIDTGDLLVTTPLAKSAEHAQEARERLDEYDESGTVGYYYRVYNSHVPPKTLKVGSKMFYVDQRAIRGFAVVTRLDVPDKLLGGLVAYMEADTWRWIEPIGCDYDRVKPPQGYAYAAKHQYLDGVSQVTITGDWLDPMPLR